MFGLLLPFAAGIAAADTGELPWWFLSAAFVTAGLIALWQQSRMALLLLLFTAGFATAQAARPAVQVPRGTRSEYALRIEGIPAGNRADAVVEAWRAEGDPMWHPASERILLRGDSAAGFVPEERIVCHGVIRPLRSTNLSYADLMRRRGRTGVLWVATSAIGERDSAATPSLHVRAARKIGRIAPEGDSGAVVRAMVAGDRSRIGSGLRTEFSRSGFAHLLSVSGLHTGMVFLLVNLAGWWLPLLRRGHLIRNVCAVGAVWCYVAATGASPSVVRAGMMYTLLQFTLFTGSEYLTLNVLSASAMLMLMWNPAWLGDISFRLSFAAVAAIVLWGLPLCRRVRTRHTWLNRILQAWIISLAAGAATAPLISHTFGTVPLAGLLLNPPAILLGTGIVLLGTLWLVMPCAAAPLFAPPLALTADLLVELTRATAAIPWGCLEYRLSGEAMTAVYLLLAGATLMKRFADRKKALPLQS